MWSDEFRARINKFRDQAEQRALGSKNSYQVLTDIQSLYSSLDREERMIMDGVFEEWASSDDPRKQFDGLALIDFFEVVSALPALRSLAAQLALSSGPSAPYDRAKVSRIIDRLESSL